MDNRKITGKGNACATENGVGGRIAYSLFYRNTDAHVHFSNIEGLPSVVCEALTAAKPVKSVICA